MLMHRLAPGIVAGLLLAGPAAAESIVIGVSTPITGPGCCRC